MTNVFETGLRLKNYKTDLMILKEQGYYFQGIKTSPSFRGFPEKDRRKYEIFSERTGKIFHEDTLLPVAYVFTGIILDFAPRQNALPRLPYHHVKICQVLGHEFTNEDLKAIPDEVQIETGLKPKPKEIQEGKLEAAVKG